MRQEVRRGMLKHSSAVEEVGMKAGSWYEEKVRKKYVSCDTQ